MNLVTVQEVADRAGEFLYDRQGEVDLSCRNMTAISI